MRDSNRRKKGKFLRKINKSSKLDCEIRFADSDKRREYKKTSPRWIGLSYVYDNIDEG